MAVPWWSVSAPALTVAVLVSAMAWRRRAGRGDVEDWGIEPPVRRPDSPACGSDPTDIEAVYEWQHVRLHFVPERCRLEVRSTDGEVKAAVRVSPMQRDGLVIHWGGDPLFLPEDADFDGADRFIAIVDAALARGVCSG